MEQIFKTSPKSGKFKGRNEVKQPRKANFQFLILFFLLFLGSNFSAFGQVNYNCATEAAVKAALAGANSYIKITLTANISLGDITGSSGFVIPAGKDVIIDLNGFDITGYRSAATNSQIIENKGTLTLQDTSSPNPEDWGMVEMNSTAMGSGNTTGSYVIQNSSGTVTIKSGRYINRGGADTPYVFNNMSSPAGGTVTVNVEGGYLQSVSSDVFRMYEWTTSATNTVNISGGTLVASGRVGWIQMGTGTTANPGIFNINIIGGELTVSDTTVYKNRSVIETYCMYKAGGDYANVNINISDGTLSSKRTNGNGSSAPTISFGMTGGTATERDAHSAVMPYSLIITGGTFDNGNGGRNVRHNAYANSALSPESIKVYGGNFTYDPEPYIVGTGVPVANYRPAGGQNWFYVNPSFVSEGLAAAGDGNDTAGTDAFEILRGNYTVDATTPNNTVKSDVNLIVNSNATLNVATNGLLTNNGSITNNGTVTVAGGTLQNNYTITNNKEFYHTGGNVDGTAGAVIINGSGAETDSNASSTVFFIDPESAASIPVTSTDIAGNTYEYVANNHWAIFEADDVVTLDLTVFLQGPMQTSGTMTNYIQTSNSFDAFFEHTKLPTTDPYGVGVTCSEINNVIAVGAIVDWIKVEIWSGVNMSTYDYSLEEERALLLRTDGSIVDVDGSVPTFDSQTGPVRIVIKHRNHLGVMSTEIASFTGTITYDFSSYLSQAAIMDSNIDPASMVEIGGKWCLWAGEVIDNDEYISNADVSIIYMQYKSSGYYDQYIATDLNMDGYVENADYGLVFAAYNRMLYSILAYFY